MIGPNGGHNIRPYLDYFQKFETPFELTYVSLNKFQLPRSEFPKIKIHNFTIGFSGPLMLIRLLRQNYDIIWYHGAYHLPVTILVYLFKRRSTKINLNVWNENFPTRAAKNDPIGNYYKRLLKKSDFVQCNWYGTRDLVLKAQPDANVLVRYWGLESSYFEADTGEEYHEETLRFIQNLPGDKFKFFFPKAINLSSHHELIIQSAHRLLEEKVNNFIIYFWLGRVMGKRYDYLVEMTDRLELNDHIKFVSHSFLPFRDIKHIWQHVDSGIQVVLKDQLSVSVIEPLYMKKELIISKIAPYIYLADQLNITLDFVENNVDSVANKMKKLIGGMRTDEAELCEKSKAIETHFNFDDNLKETLKFYRSHV